MPLKLSTTVTTLIFMKLTFAHHFVHNCTKFHKNPINGLVADIRSATDGRTGVIPHKGFLFL